MAAANRENRKICDLASLMASPPKGNIQLADPPPWEIFTGTVLFIFSTIPMHLARSGRFLLTVQPCFHAPFSLFARVVFFY
jgi:hypothetical protein